MLYHLSIDASNSFLDTTTMSDRRRVRLTFEERKQVLKWYHKYENVCEVQRQWKATYDSEPPRRETISRIRDKFDKEGTIGSIQQSTGRPRSARSSDNFSLVVSAFGDDPRKSVRQASLDLNLSRSTIHRILSESGIKPYRSTLLHKLNEDDFDRRVEFSEWFIEQSQANPDFPHMIVWSDEATFKLNGRLNRHNSIYWSADNPHQILEQDLNLPGVSVWAGISSRGLIGPFFFNGTVNGDNYLELLRSKVMPEIKGLYPDDEELPYFQQDGAPAHYASSVRSYLNSRIGLDFHSWIGRRGVIEYPPRSPDLTPLDFFFWGHLKNEVYKNPRPQTLSEMTEKITLCARNISVELFPKVCNSVTSRCHELIAVDGHHFEHLK